MAPLEITDAIVTALLAVVGLVAANSYGRHRRLRISEERLKPYGLLWAATDVAKASRIAEERPLSRIEAAWLADKLQEWYYGDHGGALVLPIPTLKMLLLILGDLKRLAKASGEETGHTRDGYGVVVALSVLRTQLKIDLDIYDLDERAQLELPSPGAPVDVTRLRELFLRRACMDPKAWGRPDRWFRPKAFHWEHYSGSLPGDVIVPVAQPCRLAPPQA